MSRRPLSHTVCFVMQHPSEVLTIGVAAIVFYFVYGMLRMLALEIAMRGVQTSRRFSTFVSGIAAVAADHCAMAVVR